MRCGVTNLAILVSDVIKVPEGKLAPETRAALSSLGCIVRVKCKIRVMSLRNVSVSII